MISMKLNTPVFLFICLSLLGSQFALSSSCCDHTPLWTNPIVPQRADPQIVLHEDTYYFIATVPAYDSIEIRSADSIDGLRDAEAKVVWTHPESGEMSGFIWAPELHRIEGKWYVYVAAGDRENKIGIRMYVLENSAEDPLDGEWTVKGRIQTPWDAFSLDATVMKLKGKNYLIWAQHHDEIPGNTNLYIAELENPWTLKGEPVLLTKPEYPWEVIGYLVNEGPYVLNRNGKLFLTYSASATDHNYCVGLLTADEDADVLDPASWTKSREPIFVSSDENSVYGPGHNCFTTTKDGKRDILVYHGRSYKEIDGDPLGNPDRHARAQFVEWDDAGNLVLGEPAPDGAYYGE